MWRIEKTLSDHATTDPADSNSLCPGDSSSNNTTPVRRLRGRPRKYPVSPAVANHPPEENNVECNCLEERVKKEESVKEELKRQRKTSTSSAEIIMEVPVVDMKLETKHEIINNSVNNKANGNLEDLLLEDPEEDQGERGAGKRRRGRGRPARKTSVGISNSGSPSTLTSSLIANNNNTNGLTKSLRSHRHITTPTSNTSGHSGKK
jgi:hypothetical protein